MAGQSHPEALPDRGDRALKRLIGERPHLTTLFIDEVMVVALRVGDLVARDPVAAVDAVQQP